MPTKVDVPDHFLKKLKNLARRYPSVLREFESLSIQLKNDERPGDKIPGTGYDVYKVRLKNPSTGKGKSGGFRVIYYLRLVDNIVLITIYSKSKQTDISPNTIHKLLEEILSSNEDDSSDEEGS
jgi:mRNA-degrading endonuclease RelE of RelBE toxin-antitoxin system